jgi:hypothetical protein
MPAPRIYFSLDSTLDYRDINGIKGISGKAA